MIRDETIKAYDEISSSYEEYSLTKKEYLDSIEKLVIKNSISNANLLDIGSGDGRRLKKISEKVFFTEILAVEPSPKMAELSKKNYDFNVVVDFAENLNPTLLPKFKNIFALWNVFGHISDNKKRLKTLKTISELLDDDGIFILDINNRHNSKSYGVLKVFFRRIIDFFYFKESRGDASYMWRIGKKEFKSFGHLFTPYEFEKLISKTDLKIRKRLTVNYNNGEISHKKTNGQLFYLISK